ncbi:MAG: hypothetical protein SGJ23_03435 [Alphaproteobacteria bacterium]|nr:hypothetical protein [Alphaproteobacteria bacterium]
MAKLHNITWLMIGCGVAGFVIHALAFASRVATNYRLDRSELEFSEALTTFILDGGWSLGFFGTAFTVEFLYRIWNELKALPSAPADADQ